MTFDTTEASLSDSAPAELYRFIAPAKQWRVTSYHKDLVVVDGTYAAVPTSRAALMTVDLATDQASLAVQIPAAHDLAQTYVNGIPMRELDVTMMRYQPSTGLFLQMWRGYASQLSFKEHDATFTVPSGTGDALTLDVPSVCAQRLCNNMLYDNQCTIARGTFSIIQTVSGISADGMTITTIGSAIPLTAVVQLSTMTIDPMSWAVHGEMLHGASGERRTIISQASQHQFTLQAPLPNGAMAIGDQVTVFAGCDHQIETCHLKFNNRLNFGGIPYLPRSNIFYVGLRGAIFNG